eukprot:m.222298 g.222298  ORF g.222298 m.222298 type:complete len:347 (+) comp25822_c1_seq18:885-1925(+)
MRHQLTKAERTTLFPLAPGWCFQSETMSRTDHGKRIASGVTLRTVSLVVLALSSPAFAQLPGCPTTQGSITIPATVETIPANQYSGCTTLTGVTFAAGSQLGSIGHSAFQDTGITTIEIPATVTAIGFDAFLQCFNLGTVTFATASQLPIIGVGAFANSGISTIEIPASVTTIDAFAFDSCANLATVTFETGSQLATIGGCAFEDSGVSTIDIPATVTFIGTDAFADTGCGADGPSIFVAGSVVVDCKGAFTAPTAGKGSKATRRGVAAAVGSTTRVTVVPVGAMGVIVVAVVAMIGLVRRRQQPATAPLTNDWAFAVVTTAYDPALTDDSSGVVINTGSVQRTAV